MQPGNSPRPSAGLCAIVTLALACALAPASASAAAGHPSKRDPSPRVAGALAASRGAYVPGEAIVRFEPGASAAKRQRARSAADARFEDTLRLSRAQLVSIDGGVRAAVRRLEDQSGVAYAQPNYRYSASAVEPPDDTFFADLWGLEDPAPPDPGVGVLDAWESSKGGGQVIAVLDTGVDLTHPDLEGNLWGNPSPDPIDEDIHGFDFVDDDGDPDDYNFHGTHVAGTAAAIAGNTQGIAGVAPEAEIMAVRVLDGNGSGSTADIAAGIDYAAEHGADVINMSLGAPSSEGDQAMSDAIDAAGAAGGVVVAAAGNEGADNDAEPHTPCALPNPNLICVAALNKSGSLAGFSNYGEKSVDIAAPGTSTLSAKTDYGPSLFGDDFEAGLGAWTTAAFDGGELWGPSSAPANGALSATDSPGGDYGQQEAGAEFLAESSLFTTVAIDLTGERGCREHFTAAYEIEKFFDGFFAGAVSETPYFEDLNFDGELFDGTSPGFPSSLLREEASISKLDGRNDAHPFFAVVSDESVQLDGAYVDDLRLFCRDETYVDEIATSGNYDQPNSGNYVQFQGTSMASPHVAGVVALVHAAEPGLSVQEVVKAVLDGASAIPSIVAGKRTATEGIADACKAIALATGGDIEADCPASSEPTPQPPDGGTDPGGPSVAQMPPPETPQQEGSTEAPEPVPTTFLRKRPAKVLRTRGQTARAVFRFGSNESGVTFLCKFDRRPFQACPPRTVRRFGLGRHVLRVKARNAVGNTDGTPAVYRFRVERIR